MKEIKQCEECKSNYFEETSKMAELCPECAHYLYGYTPCNHIFVNGSCSICAWDGSRSKYIQSIIDDHAQNS
jgi:hypothetical protein